ncbi:MAG: hypothetical protein HKN23_16020 [Verrucomicrobiales bacterium]|nr:hypothetical protein [Verrucomicrobiales bacterium]
MKSKKLPALLSVLSLFAASAISIPLLAQVEYVEPAKPYKSSGFLKSTKAGKVNPSKGAVNIPIITWAADGVTVSSNGGMKSNSGSDLAKAMGVPANLELVDDFDKQVENYVSGHSPFLRGTAGMINLASEALAELGADYEPVVIFQLSWSTGADGFVAKDIEKLSDLKGKTIVVQNAGPHVDLVQVLLEDAGLKPGDVNIKYVRDITLTDDAQKVQDPAGAFREDSSISGAACIFPDILTLTAGGTVGTGAEDSVKGAKPVLSTRTASRVIADVYAVRADFFKDYREIVHGFVSAQLKEQANFQAEIANIAKKNAADKGKVAAFKKKCEPLSEIFLLDAGAVNDYIAWVGVDLELAGVSGNIDFFSNDRNPVGYVPSSERIQNYYLATGFVSKAVVPKTAGWNFATDFGGGSGPSITKGTMGTPKAFTSTQAVRKAAESEDASLLFSSAFQFPANTSEIQWQNHKDIFDTLHEKVTRYGGAVVQLRGHSDNFFYNFVVAKTKQGEKTYKRRVPGTNEFKEMQLPKVEQVVNSADQLSYERAFAVKRAYAKYLREEHGYTNDEIDLSRFDVKGMGISSPVNDKPKTPDERKANMRGEMFIFAVEAEIPVEFGIDDLQ